LRKWFEEFIKTIYGSYVALLWGLIYEAWK